MKKTDALTTVWKGAEQHGETFVQAIHNMVDKGDHANSVSGAAQVALENLHSASTAPHDGMAMPEAARMGFVEGAQIALAQIKAASRPTSNKDGRKLAVKLLLEMEDINNDVENGGIDVMASRAMLYDALLSYERLPVEQKSRFVSVLDDFLGSCMNGGIPDAIAYEKAKPEAMEEKRLRLESEGIFYALEEEHRKRGLNSKVRKVPTQQRRAASH